MNAHLTPDEIGAQAEDLPVSERTPIFLVALQLEVAEESGDFAGAGRLRQHAAELLDAAGDAP